MQQFIDPLDNQIQLTFINKNINKYISTGLYCSEITSNIIGALILTIGIIKALFILYPYFFHLNVEKNVILARLLIAEAILLGLTFILVADVIKTIRIPSFYQLLRVSILIGIRQFLTYYLDKEYNNLKFLKKQFS